MKVASDAGSLEGGRAWLDLQAAVERWERSGRALPPSLEHARRALDVAANAVELTQLEGRAYVGSPEAPQATGALGKLVDVSRKAVEAATKARGRSRRLIAIFAECVQQKRDPRWMAERLAVALDHTPLRTAIVERSANRIDRAGAAIKKHMIDNEGRDASTVLQHALVALGVPRNAARDEAAPRKKLGT